MKAGRDPSRRLGIRFKFAAIIGVLIVIIMVVDVFWNAALQQRQAEREAHEKAEVLAAQMHAVWDFIDLNQETINRNEDGTFRTKSLVCVVTAKSVSTLFTANTDYVIRFTSQTPRQRANSPDEFEAEAFAAFEANPELESYSGVRLDDEGNQVFRYVEPLYVTDSCLECHGEPVGELDQYGYPKEGMRVGEVGGAMSITEPMDIYVTGMHQTIAQQVLMVSLMLILACFGIYVAVSRIVLNPIYALGKAAKSIGRGEFDYAPPIGSKRNPDEITEFARDFDKMARRLESLCTNLEDEVRQKTDEMKVLNDMLMYQQSELKKYIDRLGEETEYKNQFFAITSHELRTPLTSILAYARILRERSDLDERTREAVLEIESKATLLLDMVNNILVLSRAEAKKNELLPEPVDFVDLLGLVRSTFGPLAADKGIAFSAKADHEIPLSMADWEKLRRVVENLVSNAIKFVHRGGSVSVRAHFDASLFERGGIVIEVKDDGIGIGEEDRESIFALYKQAGASSSRNRYRGTGLGLAVVKELTELHEGTVSVESEYKRGSTFTVAIPYVPVEEDCDEDPAD